MCFHVVATSFLLNVPKNSVIQNYPHVEYEVQSYCFHALEGDAHSWKSSVLSFSDS
jgi:hypothetical protein